MKLSIFEQKCYFPPKFPFSIHRKIAFFAINSTILNSDLISSKKITDSRIMTVESSQFASLFDFRPFYFSLTLRSNAISKFV